jgi:UDP-MurNAc hydroxylase
MKIKFVNHSSFIIEHDGVAIISDPWLEGKVFNNGWDLISKTKMSYDDFKDINFIWFSHEHPDHFYPPNLKLIPADYKKNITVLFQNSIDGRVVNYCRKAGFKEVIELHKGKYFELSSNFKVLCEYFGEGDSWICYKAGDITILNTNDCGIRNLSQANYIKRSVGKVDILLTQFSYAYWVGNKDEGAYRKKIADEKLEWMKFQCDIFEPAVTIPIASYIYFCHEENFYLNDHVNTAEKTYNYLKQHTKTNPVVLYNGDEYTFMQDWDSRAAIENYQKDFREIELNREDKLVKNNTVPLEELYKQANIFIDNLNSTNSFIVKGLLKTTKIHLSDYNKTFTLSLKNSLREATLNYDNCDVSMTSESLLFCLKYPYGLDTTEINGRLQKPKHGRHSNFYNIFRIDQLKSRGHKMTAGYLLGVGIRKIKVKLGLFKV